MRSSRCRTAFAAAALFVVLLVVASPMAESRRALSTPTGTSQTRDTAARDAAPSPVASSATVPWRQLLSIDAPVAHIVLAQSVAPALLFWILFGLSPWIFLQCAGLTRRGRAPPFVHA